MNNLSELQNEQLQEILRIQFDETPDVSGKKEILDICINLFDDCDFVDDMVSDWEFENSASGIENLKRAMDETSEEYKHLYEE